MNIIAALVVLVLVCAAAAVAVPVLTFALLLAIAFGGFFLWLLPILIIANSDKTTGGEKLCWIVAIVFLSWFAWILYFFLAPIKQKPHQRYNYY